ncbi:prepilin-type N-terminal cleavage/methylation domain-containing protein [Methylomicrobium lacus]|uniref:prepilin-type N-terminal cleavage/methylation domain-containing protein n=1 Tax=Methylomicrobium lacus TaxID=136992 RepID=UPI0035A8E723
MKRSVKSIRRLYGQQGITLLELLISMLIGLFILGLVVGLFASMIKSDSDNIKAIQLNQELRSVMSLITRDLRRAGSNRNAAVNAAVSPTNPFSEGSARLTISPNDQGVAKSCVTYAYDSTATFGTIQATELYGFRLDSDNHTVETRASGNACDDSGWTDLTDSTLVNISGLTFDESTVSEAGITVRQITITLSGNLVRDANVSRTITETVKLRNDWY